ncbi:SusC/RagA family TonB-linked outer membrane protein [Sphingobacterium kyonggiense]
MKGRLLLFVIGLIFISSNLYAQRSVSGKVTGPDGSPLGGVTIVEKGKSNQTSSNASGNFTINVSDGATLVFRSIGFVTAERQVTGSTLNVSLREDKSAIDEVVVTAFGIERDRKSLGYSTPKVSGEEVAETQREAFFNGLQGRVPGLTVNSSNGLPGASAQIVLRGFVSISGDNNALIVIDGVPVDNSTVNEHDMVHDGTNRENDYSNRGIDINPEDIESYVIMKGAEATAMYGSQGAGGAILITTKKGKAGKATVSYSYSGRIEKPYRYPDRQYVYSQGTNGVYTGTSAYAMGPKFKEGEHLFKDNAQNFFRTGFNHKHNATIEGGSDAITYRWSNEYFDNYGVVPNTAYQRFTSRLTGTTKINNKIDVNTTFSYMDSHNDKANKGDAGYLMTLLRFNPRWDVRDWIDEGGNRVLHSSDIYNELDNPFWDSYKNSAYDDVNRILGNTQFNYKPNKWLSLQTTIGLDYSFTNGFKIYHGQSYNGSGNSSDPDLGEMYVYTRTANILTGTFRASTRHSFFEKNFSLQTNLTANVYNYYYNTDSQYGRKMYDPNFYNINNTDPEERKAKNNIDRKRNIGVGLQAIIGYKSLLYLTLTERVEGASRLMPNNPVYTYPSASIAFNFTDISGIKENLSWLDEGKLRASISRTGKEPFRSYATRSNLETQMTSGGGFAYSVYGGNADLFIETTEDVEFGTELSFFKRKFTLDYTHYRRRSIDQIFQPRLSYATGFILKTINGGVVESKGHEIQANVVPIENKNFKWNLTFNFTQQENIVKSLAKDLPETYDSDTWLTGGVRSAVFIGKSMGAISATQFKRNDRGDILINPQSGLPLLPTESSFGYVGDRIPDFTLGIVNKFRYKDFTLNFLWDTRFGGDVYNLLDYRLYTLGLSHQTLDREQPRVVQGVLEDGLENTANPTPNNIAITPYYSSGYYYSSVTGEKFVEKDIWTVRLRDITLEYRLPRNKIPFLGSKSDLSFFCTMTDLVLFTNYTGLDPESNSNTPGIGGIGGYGIDYGNMTRPIGVNFGLRLKL